MGTDCNISERSPIKHMEPKIKVMVENKLSGNRIQEELNSGPHHEGVDTQQSNENFQ